MADDRRLRQIADISTLRIKGHDKYISEKYSKVKRSVLIVDDSEINCKMLLRVLKEEYISYADEAKDGIEAVEKVRQSMDDGNDTFDIIITSFLMSRLNGMEATKQIREMGFKGMIIGLTGNMTRQVVTDFIANGANAVMSRPFKLDVYEKTVTEYFTDSSITSPRVVNTKRKDILNISETSKHNSQKDSIWLIQKSILLLHEIVIRSIPKIDCMIVMYNLKY